MVALAVPFVAAHVDSQPSLFALFQPRQLPETRLRLVLSAYSFSENKGLNARLL